MTRFITSTLIWPLPKKYTLKYRYPFRATGYSSRHLAAIHLSVHVLLHLCCPLLLLTIVLAVVFYRDILAVGKSQKNNKIAYIYWFPWVGSEDSSNRTETRIVTKHCSVSERNKFHQTVNSFLRYTCEIQRLIYISFVLPYSQHLLHLSSKEIGPARSC